MVAISASPLSFSLELSLLVELHKTTSFPVNSNCGLEQLERHSPALSRLSTSEMTKSKQAALSSIEIHDEKHSYPEDGPPPVKYLHGGGYSIFASLF